MLCPPSYLAEVHCTANFEAPRRLRSPSSLSLNVRRTQLSAVGDRAFRYCCGCTAVRTCNSLPHRVTSAPSIESMSVFRSGLKEFPLGVPSHDLDRNFPSACTVTVVIFEHLGRFLLASISPLCSEPWSTRDGGANIL